jgi:hypothetical protein
MLGNPEECRRHALECVRLAQSTAIPHRREYFAKLARTWIGLADELRGDTAALTPWLLLKLGAVQNAPNATAW